MAGLPKKYFKMFPGNLKRAWAKYKSDKGGSSESSKPKKKSAKKKAGGHSGNHKGGKMAKHKKSSGGQFGGSPMKLIMFSGIAAAGGVGTSMIVNKTPKLQDLSAGMKSGIQFGAGLAGVFFLKNKWLKSLAAGSVVAGTFGGVKAFLKVDPLAGPGRSRLSPAEMARLTGRMSAPANVKMQAPANVRMGGNSGASGWGRGGWG